MKQIVSLFVFIFLVATTVHAETIDLNEKINRSDAILIPGQSKSPLTDGIKNNIGVNFSIEKVNLKKERVIIDTSSICSNCLQKVIETNTDNNDNNYSPSRSNDVAGSQDANDENRRGKMDDEHGDNFGKSSIGGEGQAISRNAQGQNGSTIQVIDGVPYVTHDDDKLDSDKPMQITKSDTHSRLAQSPLSAVELNRAASSKNSASSPLPGGGNALLGSGPTDGFGSYESPNRKEAAAALSAAQLALKGYSKGGFHGTDGISSGKNGSLDFQKGERDRNKSKLRKPASNNIAIAKDILNKQLQMRMMSNRLEFGSSSSFIFEKVCQQYMNFAHKNGILANKAPCPKN